MGDPAAETYRWIRRVGTLLSIPLTLGLSPVVGGAIGWFIDRSLGTKPWMTIVGLLAGFAAGIRETWILIRRTSQDSDQKDEKSHPR